MNHNPIKVSTRAYFDAVNLYAWEITATTNWMMGKPGLMKKLIHTELKAGRRVSIVTFNVDLLAENALRCLNNARPPSSWCLNKAYGFSPSKPDVKYAARGYTDYFDYEGVDADIEIFKMHGSVNWVFQHSAQHPPADLVSKPRHFYVVTNEKLPQTPLTIKHKKGERRWHISPLIVLPSTRSMDSSSVIFKRYGTAPVTRSGTLPVLFFGVTHFHRQILMHDIIFKVLVGKIRHYDHL